MRVGGVGEGGGGVVDGEEDGVELLCRRGSCVGRFACNQCGDVGDFDFYARVGEWVGCEMREWAAIPVDDFGDEFGDDDGGARWEDVERGAEGEAHAEAADQNYWVMRMRGGDVAASESGEGVFGGVCAARHEM